MKKFIIKTITMILSFCLGIAVTGYLFNKNNRDMTSHMPEATLPVLYFEYEGQYINPSYGYTAQVDASCMRSAILPLDEERILTVALKKYNAEIRSVAYEVRSIDMERLIQNGTVEGMEDMGEYLTGSLKIKDLLEDSEEYLLILHVELKNYEDVQYYSRIANSSYQLVKGCTEFASGFHAATLDPDNDYPITRYLETNSSGKEDSLAYADIHSRYKTIIWGNMEVKQTKEPVITYHELGKDVVALQLDYQVTHENESGELENYQVKDYFRIRQTNMRIYLLDYERTAERIFSEEAQVFGEKSLNLGIQWSDIPYMSNEEGSVVNFVVSDELWSFDIAQNKLSKVFSFKEGEDQRGLHDEFEIQLINMDDAGSMDFIVKGYMNRGRHEGQTGIMVIHYDSLTNTTEELMFLASQECAEVLQQTVGQLIYISDGNQLYLSVAGDILSVDLNTKTVDTLTENLSEGEYVISRAGDMIAWRHGEDSFSSECITTMDMKSGVRRTYQAQEGEYLRPLGFSGNDFIYGVCAGEDVSENFSGNTLFPMYMVRIVDSEGAVIRDFDYRAKNKYVVSADTENNRINLQCVAKNEDGTYTETLAEAITSSEEEIASSVALLEINDEKKRTEQVFQFGIQIEGKRKDIKLKQVLFEDQREFALEEKGYHVFHAYGRGTVAGVNEEIRLAVQTAYDVMGVVTNDQGQVVWEQGNRKSRSVLELANGTEPVEAADSLEAGLRLLLEQEGVYTNVRNALDGGKGAYQILKQNSSKTAEDFTGCNLSAVLYYLSEGNYVLAMTEANSAELIAGYDSQNIYILDPLTGEARKEGQKEAAARYEACGNVFFSFVN